MHQGYLRLIKVRKRYWGYYAQNPLKDSVISNEIICCEATLNVARYHPGISGSAKETWRILSLQT